MKRSFIDDGKMVGSRSKIYPLRIHGSLLAALLAWKKIFFNPEATQSVVTINEKLLYFSYNDVHCAGNACIFAVKTRPSCLANNKKCSNVNHKCLQLLHQRKKNPSRAWKIWSFIETIETYKSGNARKEIIAQKSTQLTSENDNFEKKYGQ